MDNGRYGRNDAESRKQIINREMEDSGSGIEAAARNAKKAQSNSNFNLIQIKKLPRHIKKLPSNFNLIQIKKLHTLKNCRQILI